MNDNEQRGGVASPKSYPSANEQMDIIRYALDALDALGFLRKTDPGNYAIGPWRLRFHCVYGEISATLSKRENGTVIDQYVGQHPLMWILEGPLTPNFIEDQLHAELDKRGYGTGV